MSFSHREWNDIICRKVMQLEVVILSNWSRKDEDHMLSLFGEPRYKHINS